MPLRKVHFRPHRLNPGHGTASFSFPQDANMRIDRSEITPEKLAAWPSVLVESLSSQEQDRFLKASLAMELFARGSRLADIEQKTGFRRHQLYRLVRRATTVHKDGRIFGFRAFLSNVRVKPHHREAPIKHSYLLDHKAGKTGAMAQLLASYPELNRVN
jgi:putative transposase